MGKIPGKIFPLKMPGENCYGKSFEKSFPQEIPRKILRKITFHGEKCTKNRPLERISRYTYWAGQVGGNHSKIIPNLVTQKLDSIFVLLQLNERIRLALNFEHHFADLGPML
jgi:hypothetical protein